MAEEKTEKSWPGYTGECHPDVWSIKAKPEQPKESKPGQITPEQIDKYFNEGVVLVDNYFTTDELEPIKKDIEDLVEVLAAKLYDGGKIKQKYEEYGLFERLTMINREFPGANIMLHKLGVMPQVGVRFLTVSKLLSYAYETSLV